MRIVRTAVLADVKTVAAGWQRLCDAVRAGSFPCSHWEAYVEDRRGSSRSFADTAHRKLDVAGAQILSWRGNRFLSHADVFDETSETASMRLAVAIPRPVASQLASLSAYSGADLLVDVDADDRVPFERIANWTSCVRIERLVDRIWVTYSEEVAAASPLVGLAVPPELGPVGWERSEITLTVREARMAHEAMAKLHELLASPVAPPRLTPAPVHAGAPPRTWNRGLKAAFEGEGWAYSEARSEPRSHVVERKTPLGNLLVLTVDIGGAGTPRWPSLDLAIERPELCARVRLMEQQTIETERQWSATCLLARAEIDRCFAPLAEAVDSILGPAPDWNGELMNIRRIEAPRARRVRRKGTGHR